MFERRQAAAVAGDSQGCILGVVLCELLCDSRNQLEEVLELPSTDDGASLGGYCPTMSSHSRSRSDGSTAAAARQVRSVKHSSRG